MKRMWEISDILVHPVQAREDMRPVDPAGLDMKRFRNILTVGGQVEATDVILERAAAWVVKPEGFADHSLAGD